MGSSELAVERAYKMGYSAQQHGVRINKNPFTPNQTAEQDAWRLGYRDGADRSRLAVARKTRVVGEAERVKRSAGQRARRRSEAASGSR